ncbi:hypothetical protein BDV96DRAFT_683009 [Lophiotrema nucula]|uniref:Uncharacterized protein n=1 Tax=Lophiotrema nucula TaxID=690887 RepID=A0A6A5ZNV9_9PLEO|nr:hypothetical protein BDV96DRAFT_683009 [Lophiotrema nucula]
MFTDETESVVEQDAPKHLELTYSHYEEWKGAVLKCIDERIEAFEKVPLVIPKNERSVQRKQKEFTTQEIDERIEERVYEQADSTQLQDKEGYTDRSSTTTDAAQGHRLLHTAGPVACYAMNNTKILKLVLSFDPVVTLIAIGVSRKWRDIAYHLFKMEPQAGFFGNSNSSSVDRGQPVSESTWSKPMNKEIEELSDKLTTALDFLNDLDEPDEVVFVPAKYTESKDVSSERSAQIRMFVNDQHELLSTSLQATRRLLKASGEDYSGIRPLLARPRPLIPRWLDWTQFRLNPCFEALFDRRLEAVNGRYEIDLRPDSRVSRILTNRYIFNQAIKSEVGPMYITHPPCKSVTVCEYREGQLHSLVRKNCMQGIRVRDLLRELEEQAPEVLKLWIQHARDMRARFEKDPKDQDLWNMPGAPRLVVCLGNLSTESHSYWRPTKIHMAEEQHLWMTVHSIKPLQARRLEWISEEMVERGSKYFKR